MKVRDMFITDLDLGRLRGLISCADAEFSFDQQTSRTQLIKMLENARVVTVRDMPYDVVTMNSQIYLRDLNSNEKWVAHLVFPEEENSSQYAVSVVSPLGVSLLGRNVKNSISYKGPEGIRELKIEQLLYQPEADMNLQHRFSVSTGRMGKIENGSDIFF